MYPEANDTAVADIAAPMSKTPPPAWSPEQVAALAPDASSRKAAEGLASPPKWLSLGQEATDQGAKFLWGECPGSGSNPYQTAVALAEPAFHCSCPSRKFPCKHALALFLLFSRQPQQIPIASPPQWVSTWRHNLAARAAKTAAKSSSPAAGATAQARRAAKRAQTIANGLDELEQWLHDLIRHGLAAAQSQPYAYWQGMAARLVDAQAPGLSRQVRQIAGLVNSGAGWEERLLHRLGLLYLLIQGYRRLEALPPERQADVRAAVGWSVKREEVLTGSGARARWLIVGRRTEEEDGLRTQRTWLWNPQSSKPALILDFAYGGQPLDVTLLPGHELEAELLFYPSSAPLRAICKMRFTPLRPISYLSQHETLATAVAQFNGMIAQNPWLEAAAFPLTQVTPVMDSSGSYLYDAAHNRLPITPSFAQNWELLALSGGHPIELVAEWDGATCLPLSVWDDGRFVSLS